MFEMVHRIRLAWLSGGFKTPLLKFLRDEGIKVGFDACTRVMGRVSTHGVTIALIRSAFTARVLDNFSNGQCVIAGWAGSSHR